MNKLLKIHVAFIFLFCFTIQAFSQNFVQPRPVSPSAELKQRIGFTDITVNYSRPRINLRGVDRTGKIWGKLVPFGLNEHSLSEGRLIPWRAGANENTTIKFTDDVRIDGKKISKGIYGLHMIIHKDNRATLIFSKNHTGWGSFNYEASEDVLRVEVKTQSVAKTELLTYSFIDYEPILLL